MADITIEKFARLRLGEVGEDKTSVSFTLDQGGFLGVHISNGGRLGIVTLEPNEADDLRKLLACDLSEPTPKKGGKIGFDAKRPIGFHHPDTTEAT